MNFKIRISMALVAILVFVSGGAQSLLKLADSAQDSHSPTNDDSTNSFGHGSGATCESST